MNVILVVMGPLAELGSSMGGELTQATGAELVVNASTGEGSEDGGGC
jgi:hypothetical protein